MPRKQRPSSVKIGGDDDRFVHAVWSRSGGRVIVSVGRTWDDAQQVELTPDQAGDLAGFLAAGPADPAGSRR